MEYFNKHNFLFDNQFGFRANHSTTDALYSSVNMIKTESHNHNHVMGIFLDLSKAFDTVDHTILLHKLNHYGIRGNSYLWFQSYLSNRTQFTVIDGISSSHLPVSTGVPQGSILGPLLFLIYINDIQFAHPQTKLTLFADDTNVFVVEPNLQQLFSTANKVCSSLAGWFSANRLTVNISKSAFMIFSTTKADDSYIFDNKLELKLNNCSLSRVNTIKFLGLLIDDRLTFKQHVKELTSKINNINSMLFNRKQFVPLSARRNLYLALVYSKINFSIEIYGSATQSTLQPLLNASNKTLRTLQNKSRFSDVKQLYISYNILPVQLLYKLNIAKIVYKCLHCKETVSIVMYEIFNKNCFNHSVNTRLCSTKYLYLQANSSIFKSLIYLATLIWNSIPINIRQSPTVNTFSMSYRNYILENWQ